MNCVEQDLCKIYATKDDALDRQSWEKFMVGKTKPFSKATDTQPDPAYRDSVLGAAGVLQTKPLKNMSSVFSLPVFSPPVFSSPIFPRYVLSRRSFPG